MKAILLCVCALALCAFAAEVREGGTFVPYKLPCGFRIDYNSTIEGKKFSGWISMYGKYYTSYQKGLVEGIPTELYAICRIDIHDPKDANTVAVFFGMIKDGQKLCQLIDYNKPESPYHEMSDYYEWFTEEFKYTSKIDDADWKGTKCKAYNNSYATIYADDNNKIIAVDSKGKEYVLEDLVYREKARESYFMMPKDIPSCDSKVYKGIEKVSGCDLEPDTASFSGASVFAVVLAMVVSLLAMF